MTEAEVIDRINSTIKKNGNRTITGDEMNFILKAIIELIAESGGTVNWGDIEGTIADQLDLASALNNKVDVVSGKGLSENDFTNTLKIKLDGIQAGAEANVNADWNATSGDAVILNKPTIPNPANFVAKADYTPAHSILVQQSGTGSPTSVQIGNNEILGRKSGGGSNIEGLSVSEVKSLLNYTASDVGAVATNSVITGATKTKITYDAKGLVTVGADATTADIADSSNKRYQTDNQQLFNDATSSIQTQLDAKQSKLLAKKLGASATIATTVESIIGNVEILGGTLASTDYLNIKSRARKTGGIGTYLLRYYLNTTSNSLTGATQIAISGTQTTSSIISASFERDFTIDGGNLIGFPFGTASNDGTTSASTVSSVAYTVATTYYIITTITLVSALDTASLIGQKITNF